MGSIPGLGGCPGEEKGYPLQYCGLENCMDCIVHGVTKNRTQLSNRAHTQFKALINVIYLFKSKNLHYFYL